MLLNGYRPASGNLPTIASSTGLPGPSGFSLLLMRMISRRPEVARPCAARAARAAASATAAAAALASARLARSLAGLTGLTSGLRGRS